MRTEYNGITIVYDELKDKFIFTLRGRERWADSLTKAKVAIDTPVKNKKESTFEPVEAYHRSYYSQKFEKVKVTSMVDCGLGRQPDFWISNSGKNRSKVGAHNIYPITDSSTKIVNECNAIIDQIAELHAQVGRLSNKVKCMEVPEEEK